MAHLALNLTGMDTVLLYLVIGLIHRMTGFTLWQVSVIAIAGAFLDTIVKLTVVTGSAIHSVIGEMYVTASAPAQVFIADSTAVAGRTLLIHIRFFAEQMA